MLFLGVAQPGYSPQSIFPSDSTSQMSRRSATGLQFVLRVATSSVDRSTEGRRLAPSSGGDPTLYVNGEMSPVSAIL